MGRTPEKGKMQKEPPLEGEVCPKWLLFENQGEMNRRE
jgi:hypothetical protein